MLAHTLVVASILAAQPTPGSAPGPEPGTPGQPAPAVEPAPFATVTRADLAAAYLRFEKIYRALPDKAQRTREANQAFDRATAAFFGGNMTAAIRSLHDAADALAAAPAAPAPDRRLASSLRVWIDPPVWVRGTTPAPRIRVRQFSTVTSDDALAAPLRATLRVHVLPLDSDGEFSTTIDVSQPAARANAADPTPEVTAEVPIDPAFLESAGGAYAVVWGVGEELDQAPVQFSVLSQPTDAFLAGVRPRLEALKPAGELSASAIATLRGKAALISPIPDPFEAASFMTSVSALMDSLAVELTLAEAGKNPFKGRTGRTWRLLTTDQGLAPYNIHTPAQAPTTPWPVVIAFHGAGGDEFMFMTGYGDGELRRQADQRGFLAVSPRAELFMNNPANLEKLIEELARDHTIDRARIYLLGHSMGAGAVTSLASARPDLVAAGVALAGGGRMTKGPIAPVLMIAAQFDPIIPSARLEVAAQEAAAAGLPVEFRKASNQGHTLMVGDTLGEALDWLWPRTLRAPKP
jgi:predicted esterase